MKKTWIILFLFVLILSACGGEPQTSVVETGPNEPKVTDPPTPLPRSTATQVVSGAQITPIAESPVAVAFDGLTLSNERGEYFAASGVCSTCHTGQIDGEGNDLSIDSFWRATMMANSARDPYWQASLRAETLAHPDFDAIIQDTCSNCHTPMARTTQKFGGGEGIALDDGFLNPENELHALGIDGISCALCHQIEAEGLGKHESFDGGYIVDNVLMTGDRINYGPYEVTPDLVTIMQSTSGYIPQKGAHIQTSEICATCHTLYTPTIDNNGEVAGLFAEQTPYQEWEASDFAEQQSCQDCHMPETSTPVMLSVTGGPERSPFSQHSFVGGNTYALSLLRHFGEEIEVTASSTQIEAAQQRANAQLQEQTAQISIEKIKLTDATLNASISLMNQVGHKLPSGYPSRRVWIHFTVYDAQGIVIFDSGNWSANGSIVGNDNDQDAAAYEAHYDLIENPDQVQIYEAIIGDVDGQVTTTLLRGAGYLKDNRILPAGFDKNAVDEDIAVYGFAFDDANFQGGGDKIEYQVPISDVAGPFTVTVELLYQSIGYRWAQNLTQYQAPEPERFLGFYEALPNMPVVVAIDVAEVAE